MSELGDTIAALQAQQAQLDEHSGRFEKVEARTLKLEQGMAEVDRAQQTFENLIEVFRVAMKDECERLRRELRTAMNGR